MKKQLYKYILFIGLFLPVYLFAQPTKPADHDMTGLWKGTLYNDTTNKFLPYEIAISEEKGKLVGYSYTLFEEDGKKEVGVKRIKIKIKDDEVIIEDVEMISNNYSIAPPKKVKVQSILSLYLNDTSMQLSGRWSTNKTWEYRQLTGTLQVNRAIDYKETALFERLIELKLTKDLSFVQPDRNPTGADIAIKEKPEKEKKLPIETPEKLVAVEKQKEVIAAQDTKTSIVADNKKTGKEIVRTEETVAKKVVDTPTNTKPAADEKNVLVTDKPVDKAIAKADAPVSKTIIDKPTNVIDKKVALPATANEVVVKEKQPADQSIAKAAAIEKPSTITPTIPAKKTDITVKDTIAKNGRPVDVVAIKPAEKPKPIVVPPVEKKKEIVVAVNDSKVPTKQAAVVNTPAAVPPPVTKPPAPIVAVKESARQNDKPVAAVAKTPAVAEKPIVISLPKEPVKTENKPLAAVVVPAEKKKEIPVEIAAPVVVAAPIVLAAANVADRKMKNEQAVYFESDSLVLTLYDNGEVDGDTVSVLMNGQIIFAKQGLSTKANSKTIYIDKSMSDSLSMVMYAENLGSIPPNTGLLIIMDGEKRYEVRFSADLQTNAAILLRRKQKEK